MNRKVLIITLLAILVLIPITRVDATEYTIQPLHSITFDFSLETKFTISVDVVLIAGNDFSVEWSKNNIVVFYYDDITEFSREWIATAGDYTLRIGNADSWFNVIIVDVYFDREVYQTPTPTPTIFPTEDNTNYPPQSNIGLVFISITILIVLVLGYKYKKRTTTETFENMEIVTP